MKEMVSGYTRYLKSLFLFEKDLLFKELKVDFEKILMIWLALVYKTNSHLESFDPWAEMGNSFLSPRGVIKSIAAMQGML
jgi:hypothetical protein